MKRKIARALRRLADKLNAPAPAYWPVPDPQVDALLKQTKAIEEMTGVLKNRQGIGEAVNNLAVGIAGPGIVRAVNYTRADGVPDSEILDTLVERLTDGWF